MRAGAMALIGLALAAGGGHAEPPPAGLYQLTARLELPHLERYAVERSRRVCVGGGGSGPPVPVISASMPFAGCEPVELARPKGRFGYDIVCPGRDAARARAEYKLRQNGFRGRVAIVMGAKNMTMTEVQTARRLGACTMAAGD